MSNIWPFLDNVILWFKRSRLKVYSFSGVWPNGLPVFKLICKCNYFVCWPNTWLSKWNLITYITAPIKNWPIFRIIHDIFGKRERVTQKIAFKIVVQCKKSILNTWNTDKVAFKNGHQMSFNAIFIKHTPFSLCFP